LPAAARYEGKGPARYAGGQQQRNRTMAQDQTNEPQAIRNKVGAPRPEYDQYEVNQAQNVNDDTSPKPAKLEDAGNPIAADPDMGSQPGYGNARTKDGESEKDAAKEG